MAPSLGVPVPTQTALEIPAAAAVAAPVTDEQLVVFVLAGDRRAFELLVRRHQTGVVNHLYRQTGQRELAWDLAQEVFLKVYTSLPRFDPKYRFTTWVYRIATNRAIDLMRRKTVPVCSLDETIVEGPRRASLTDSTPGPHEMARCSQLQRRIASALGELPEEYRRLLLLRNEQHFSYHEISRITDLPVGTVKNRIFRARAQLRDLLGDLLDPAQAQPA
jgi:RNA polymerase sigma-70 factor (ECF subfamily)